jgi:hypothetical protein
LHQTAASDAQSEASEGEEVVEEKATRPLSPKLLIPTTTKRAAANVAEAAAANVAFFAEIPDCSR